MDGGGGVLRPLGERGSMRSRRAPCDARYFNGDEPSSGELLSVLGDRCRLSGEMPCLGTASRSEPVVAYDILDGVAGRV